MNLPRLIERNIQQRKLSSFLTALSVALGVMLVIAILIVQKQMEDAYQRPGKGFSLVVGPPQGSPLTLVMNTIYHVDQSQGRLPMAILDELRELKYVKHAVPYAVGDAFRGFRVVATTDALFSKYFPHPAGEGKEKFEFGGPFPFDRRSLKASVSLLAGVPIPDDCKDAPVHNHAVIGAAVAEALDINVGYEIEPTHGVEGGQKAHEERQLWTVTGILKRTNTPVDRVVFINLDSFYRIPDHAIGGVMRTKDGKGWQAAISSIVVFPRGSTFKALLYARLKAREDIKVAEVNSELKKLFDLVGGVRVLFVVVSALVAVIGVVSIMVAIYNTMNERRREIAILRSIGARRLTVMGAIVAEAATLAFLGALAGLLMAHGLVALAAGYVEKQAHFRPDSLEIQPIELGMLGVVTMVGALAGLVPAWKAYRTDVASNIAPMS